MAQFNPADYETVAERITRFYKDHKDGRIVTENVTTSTDRAVSTWVVKASVYLPMYEIWDDAGAPENPENGWYLKATGYAFEVDGSGGANKTSALENAETSAIGRCLANAGYSGDRRATREEMQKVERDKTPQAAPIFTEKIAASIIKKITDVTTVVELRKLWVANAQVLDIGFVNSLGDQVTLKTFFTNKAAELEGK